MSLKKGEKSCPSFETFSQKSGIFPSFDVKGTLNQLNKLNKLNTCPSFLGFFPSFEIKLGQQKPLIYKAFWALCPSFPVLKTN